MANELGRLELTGRLAIRAVGGLKTHQSSFRTRDDLQHTVYADNTSRHGYDTLESINSQYILRPARLTKTIRQCNANFRL